MHTFPGHSIVYARAPSHLAFESPLSSLTIVSKSLEAPTAVAQARQNVAVHYVWSAGVTIDLLGLQIDHTIT